MGADLNSTSSDIYHQIDNNETKTHYERRLDSFPVISKNSGNIILDTEKNIATILLPVETKQQTEVLSEDFKQEFIEKLKKLPDYEGSKVQEAIEKGTIEIKKIPGRDGYAIYKSKTGNLVFITGLDGTGYTNVDYFRQRPFYEDGIKSGYLRQGYGKIELISGLWKLYNKDGREVTMYSDEYMVATLNAINTMWDVKYALDKEIKRRKGD